jgi:GT2 family glycosyltransferase
VSPPTGAAWQLIVLSWNGLVDPLACLDSTRRIERDDVAVICVDNGSTDGTPAAVRERFPEVTLIANERNLGFAAGNNVGIEHALDAGARWVVLVNNDMLLAPDVVDGFEAAAAGEPDAGILAGKVLFADRPETIWFAGQRINALLGYSGRPRGYGRRDGPRYGAAIETDRAVGALMAISAPALRSAGAFDPDLFAYVEDVDLALRVRAAGFKVIVAPAARGWHRVSASTGGEAASTHTLYYGARNTVVVLDRRRPLPRAAAALRRGAILLTFALHALTRANRAEALRAVRDGYEDARRNRLGERAAADARARR